MNTSEMNEQISTIKDILLEVKSNLKEKYGTRFINLFLYGSYARGEAREESDIDLILVLSGEVNSFREIDSVVDVTYDIGLKYNVVLSVLPISEYYYQNMETSFIELVKEEGVIV